MATRRLLSKLFQGRQLLHMAQNILDHGNGSAQCAKIDEFQRFDPWYLQRWGVVMSAQSLALLPLLHGDRWFENLKNLNNAGKDRLCVEVVPKWKKSAEEGRRLRKLVQMDSLIKRLRQIPHASISREEFLQICMESAGEEDANEVVKSLDESGQIIIVGDCVYLRPEQVARVMENILPLLNDHHREELEEMKKQKAEIDAEAEKIVRRELWGGLGLMSLQTAYLMWLTFWKLSWDVMEPICFFVTSSYFLAGYAFFLTTSTDPTFENIFTVRFKNRQKRLMKTKNFNIERYKELRMLAGKHLPRSIQDRQPLSRLQIP